MGGATALASGLFALECSLYSAVTPLLPRYAAADHLSSAAAGVLAASYSIGFLLGAPLGGWMAARGIRRTVLSGLVLFAFAAALFGVVSGAAPLDCTRAVQGAAGGVIWGGGLLWLIAATAPQRRGRALGIAFGASTAGTLLGPVLGTIAVSAGSPPVFGGVGGVAVLFALRVRRLPAPPPHVGPARSDGASRERVLLAAALVIALIGATLGAIGVLVPLRLAAQGASGVVIGVVFLAAAALAALVAPLAGALTDRRSPIVPIRGGLLAVCASLLGLAVADRSPVAAALLTVTCVGAAAGGCIGPCMALGAAAAERGGISLAATVAALNLAFAVGESAGALGGPRLAQSTGDLAPLLALSGAVGLVAVALAAGRRRAPRMLAPGGPGTQPARRTPAAARLAEPEASSLTRRRDQAS